MFGGGIVVVGGGALAGYVIAALSWSARRPIPGYIAGAAVGVGAAATGAAMIVVGSRRMKTFNAWYQREKHPWVPSHGVTVMAAGGATMAASLPILALSTGPAGTDTIGVMFGGMTLAVGSALMLTGGLLHRRYRDWDANYLRRPRLSLPAPHPMPGGGGLAWSGRF